MAIIPGFKLTVTNNVRVPLATVNTPAKWIMFQPKMDATGSPTNTGAVWLGDITITPTAGGTCLNPGDSTVAWPGGSGEYLYDLQQIYIVAATGGDGVQYIYGA